MRDFCCVLDSDSLSSSYRHNVDVCLTLHTSGTETTGIVITPLVFSKVFPAAAVVYPQEMGDRVCLILRVPLDP